jgi:hypothetical protein
MVRRLGAHEDGEMQATTTKSAKPKTARDNTLAPPRVLHPIPHVRQMLGGIANATIYKLISDGTLPTVTVGRRRFVTDDGIAACVTTLQRRSSR